VHLGREKVRNELAKIGWPGWVLGAAEAVKGWAVSQGLMTAGGAAATGGGAAATGGGAAAAGGGAAAAGGAALTGPGWLAIGAAVVVTAVTVIAVAELYKWATAKPPAEPAAVTKPAESNPGDKEPDKFVAPYKNKALQDGVDEFMEGGRVTPQTPAPSGGSSGTGSVKAPTGNVMAPTGTSEEGGSSIQFAASPSETPSETPLPPTPDDSPMEVGGGGGDSGIAQHEPPTGVGDSTKIAAAPPATDQHTQPPPDDPSIGGTAHPTGEAQQIPPPAAPPADASMGGTTHHPT